MKKKALIRRKRMVKKSRKLDIYTSEYEKIIGINTATILINSINKSFEWQKKGDFFKKFTTFEEYTPIRTSGNTILCK